MVASRADYESAIDQCLRKHHYRHKAAAKRDRGWMMAGGSVALNVYRCSWCEQGWLLGGKGAGR